ncbi:MAG: zinc ribbon domain-containing protein [Bacilli bacterium]|nr:zinc ribbon domain-containing protein [Bacilli bacterium]
MFCPRCGDPIESNENFCNKCGTPLANINQNTSNKKSTNTKRNVFVGLGLGFSLLLIIFTVVLIVNSSDEEYYFSEQPYISGEEDVITKGDSKPKNKYSTVIVTDNFYEGQKIESKEDADKLIVEDSVSQKSACPKEIKSIEDEIISKYGVTAVNLCELDLEFAKEISNVFKTIYEEYPSLKGELTNFSLVNTSMSESYIAVFMIGFKFATSDSRTTYPWVYKTQILLNTKYFLNSERLESSVISASNSGHFPKNATRYSPVAHEIGHYLSFIATMKAHDVDSFLLMDNTTQEGIYSVFYDRVDGSFSLEMIEEAYNNYKKEKGTTLSIDEWRGTISDYALAKDNEGNYIYDETIAEAFHDVYLNDDDAAEASKYIVEVLKSKLEG